MKAFKNCHLFLASMAVVLLFCLQVSAQNIGQDFKDKTPEERAKFQTDMMINKLSLNAEQQTKVQAVNLKYAQKFDPIIKSNDSKLSRFKQAMALQKAKDAELKRIFTAGQYKQYEDFEQELKGKMKGKF